MWQQAIPSYPLPNMPDFSLLLVAKRHTIKSRTKPPTTPKIMGVLLCEDLICVLSAGLSPGGAGGGGGSIVEL